MLTFFFRNEFQNNIHEYRKKRMLPFLLPVFYLLHLKYFISDESERF